MNPRLSPLTDEEAKTARASKRFLQLQHTVAHVTAVAKIIDGSEQENSITTNADQGL